MKEDAQQNGQKRILVAILSILVAIIVGLVVAIIINHNINSDDNYVAQFGEIGSEDFLANFDRLVIDDANEKQIEDYLLKVMSETNDAALFANSCAYLATLKSWDNENERAATILEDCINNERVELSANQEASLLFKLDAIYMYDQKKAARIKTLERLLVMPDDIYFDSIEWPEFKTQIRETIDNLKKEIDE